MVNVGRGGARVHIPLEAVFVLRYCPGLNDESDL